MKPATRKPPLWTIWWVASRPHTLTASLSPVVVGYNAGLATILNVDRTQYLALTIQWATFCMLMQLGTNLHNDYADFVKGADTNKRLGQARATQKGWLSPFQTAAASTTVLGIGLLLGWNFISHLTKGSTPFWVTSFIVITSVFNAFAYTGGPWPLGYIGLGSFSIGYSGLGDLFVFLYFGLVATLFLPFLYISFQDDARSKQDVISAIPQLILYAVQVAVLATNIIVVNNLRDRVTDVDANKRTLAVRYGATFCRREYTVNVAIAYMLVLLDVVLSGFRLARLLPLITFPLARKELYVICQKDGSDLNPHVGGAAKIQFLFCILLGIALRLG